MIEKVWAIKSVEEKIAKNNNPYLCLIIDGDDEKEHKQTIFDPNMFQVFKNNLAVKVQLDKPQGATRWEIKSAVAVSEELKPPQKPIPPDYEPPDEPEKPPVPPQAVGMTTKEVGDMIRAGKLAIIFGKKIANDLVAWYQVQILGNSRIEFDAKDLPTFGEP